MANTELRREPVAVKNFFDSVAVARKEAGDTRLPAEAAKELLGSAEIKVPQSVQNLLARFPDSGETQAALLDSVTRGVNHYKTEHGFEPDASLIEHAMHNATVSTFSLAELTGNKVAVDRSRAHFDSATNLHHDQLSLQPAQAMVSIMAQFAEAIPYAAYLPADIKNNEARLAIMSNRAQRDFGNYVTGDVLDGIAGGLGYLDSERLIQLSVNGGAGPFAFQVAQRADVAVAAGNVAMPLLRGRTVILVNGLPVARDAENEGTGSNPVSGSVTIAGTAHAIGGTVNTDTGALSITANPALPAGTLVHALAYIDFERPEANVVTPLVGVDVTVFKLFARASRGIVRNTVDAMTQIQGELNLDPRGQALLSVRSQYAQERHYRANAKMLLAAQGTGLVDTWNYNFAAQTAEKSRAEIWLDFAPVVASLSQRMANATVDHGITTLYMTGELAAQVRGLPSSIWEPSGITDRPGIYRLGRLFGLYDVYYTPRGLTETNNGQTSQILCVGRATNVARNPIVLGDAVPPMFLPLAMGQDFVQPDGFYTRSFTELNPHGPSARGSALINVTNIK